MTYRIGKQSGLMALAVIIAGVTPALAQTADTKADTHVTAPSLINAADIKPRALSDWEAEWQSVYPFLQDGTLDPMIAHKAEKGDRTVAQYRAYYGAGYQTDVDRIVIAGSDVTFHRGDQSVQAAYENDGYEILTYASGNQGVRFIFEKTNGDADAPQFIQFSDHKIVPTKADHYHLYWGDDRLALLDEVTNWPTYFPADLSGSQILADMLAH